ncbi:uncharacterized protein [Rutidosis leptorrhynchoides]|uniref:uncharacterized protein n=1 Tax=Rutidosis leptorrhynchoides TaxID=125765 RepID=UPI003A995E18
MGDCFPSATGTIFSVNDDISLYSIDVCCFINRQFCCLSDRIKPKVRICCRTQFWILNCMTVFCVRSIDGVTFWYYTLSAILCSHAKSIVSPGDEIIVSYSTSA